MQECFAFHDVKFRVVGQLGDQGFVVGYDNEFGYFFRTGLFNGFYDIFLRPAFN